MSKLLSVQYPRAAMKIGIYSAHPDDYELACGGRALQHVAAGDDVYAVIGSTGQTSHVSALGIEENPSPADVRTARKQEAEHAADILGVRLERLETPGSGRIRENRDFVRDRLRELSRREEPDVVYYHAPDAHADHSVLHALVEDMLAEGIISPSTAYMFSVWAEDVVEGRGEDGLQEGGAPPAGERVRFDISDELPTKREAIRAHRSQVLRWPYPRWQVQDRPVLGRDLLNHFLKPEEVFFERR